ncbi:MAG TPA: right-handed parallel beta-helix repeat-containing protein [Roseiflexaceae bacterium]|jgi:parallel beta-helix repeat protein|nr:right-handed parallel beta-helix repeat-containing protein [Roseiflexaceae bacterium]
MTTSLFVRQHLHTLICLCATALALAACSSAQEQPAAPHTAMVTGAQGATMPQPTSVAPASAASSDAVPASAPAPAAGARPCDAPATSTPAAAAKNIPAEWVTYSAGDNTIVVHAGANLTLADAGHALGQPAALKEIRPGEWLLGANLEIDKGATLQIGAPSVQRLKLRSDAGAFVWIKALGGTLEFSGVCVTSWDTSRNAVDEQPNGGRSFVLARDGARMDIRDSELSYLGYDANESYGVAWRLQGTTGTAENSRFGYNWYGMYSYEASDLVIRGNEVHHSARYGIDPHTRSNHLTIENNVSHHNGKHGIILAEDCSNSVIRNNVSYANDMHGIVIYLKSNNNVVENNTVYGNQWEGIDVNDSTGTAIRSNTVHDNGKAGIGVGQDSKDTTVIGNHITSNQEDGIAIYSDASGTAVQGNVISGNARYGIYVKSAGNDIAEDNKVTDNRVENVKTS